VVSTPHDPAGHGFGRKDEARRSIELADQLVPADT
jgi:hypothetical protein